MLLRKSLVPALALCAALLAVTCDENKDPKAAAVFITPTNGSKVPPEVVPVSIKRFLDNCVSDSIALLVDGVLVGTDRTRSFDTDTVGFSWDASNQTPGARPVLAAVLYTRERRPANPSYFTDTTSIEVLVDTGGGPVMRIVAPEDGDTLGQGAVPILVWAPDTGVGIHRVEFLVDEALVGADSFGNRDTWRCTWDAAQALPGTHAIEAKVYDRDGHRSVDSIAITIRGSGPTHHGGYVDTSETWSPGGNPHIVDSSVTFRSNAWLTIEPGCVVKFEKGHLAFGLYGPGGLTAVGTAGAPVLFTSNRASPAPGDWTGVRFGGTTLAGTRLGYCTVEYAGMQGVEAGAITLSGGCKVDEISDCTVRQSAGFGVFCVDSSGFGAFRNNQVTANRSYGMHVGPQFAALLAAGNVFSGNDSAGVELHGWLSVSTTWPDLGEPYVIRDVSVGDSTNNPVLTIQPGTEIRFKNLGTLRVGNAGVAIPARIIADGSAGRIKFTSAAATPAPGSFYGVYVYGNQIGESEFRNCDFSYGGQNGDCLLYVKNSNPVITGCDFGYSGGWGISFRTPSVPDTVALKQTNTFHDNTIGDIKWLPSFPGD